MSNKIITVTNATRYSVIINKLSTDATAALYELLIYTANNNNNKTFDAHDFLQKHNYSTVTIAELAKYKIIKKINSNTYVFNDVYFI